jgi:hypothetical protein
VIEADVNTLSRTLFRALWGALNAARGGVLRIELRKVPGGGELCLAPVPGAGVAQIAPAAVRLMVPAIPWSTPARE